MRLILARDGGGPRHFLGGEPVHCGTGLEMKVAAAWVPVRYEGALQSYGSADPTRAVLLAAPWGDDGPEVSVCQPEMQELRWPEA